jgi:hypothetical protein
VTVRIDTVIYNRRNLASHRSAAVAVAAGVPAAMFGRPERMFRFADDDALLRGLTALRGLGWPEDTTQTIAQFVVPRPQVPAERAGIVRVGDVYYENAEALGGNAVFHNLAAHADVINSAAFEALARDTVASRWQFDDWDALALALQGWVPDQPYTQALAAHRIARLAESVAAQYNPVPTIARAALDSAFGNCGATAKNLIGRIQDLGGTVEMLAEEEGLLGDEGAATLLALLQAQHQDRVLINIGNPVIHEFVLERAPDGTFVLQQGYQGGYDALWWAELGHGRSVLAGGDVPKMTVFRQDYGGSRQVDMATLRRNLTAFMKAPGLRSECARTAWQLLPFRYLHEFQDDGDPTWNVRVWAVRTPQTVIGALAARHVVDPGYNSWLTTAVLQEANGNLQH